MPELPSILARITTQTRADLEQRKAARPLHTFRDGLAPSDRSLERALSSYHRTQMGFILECKKASPSRGLLREDFDPVALAQTYEANGADAISVLTDAPFFQGSFAFLQAVREAVSVPVLCKDFVVDPYQVYEARSHGADAILLMMSVLDDATYRACAAACAELSVDALTETHDAQEIERALGLGARIIGVNNRDLKTLEVDLYTTERLEPYIPIRGCVFITESGIGSHHDVLRLRNLVDGFLIGTSLVSARDTARAAREIILGRFKVCGLTRVEDARAAYDAGATFGGLIFAPESPRAVSLETARELTESVPELSWVGVFVNADPAEITYTARELGLEAVQLHGEESRAYVESMREMLPGGCEVWKAVRVRDAIPALEDTGADRLLLDAFKAGQRGGTGHRFDWSLLDSLEDRDHILLSGGIGPENAAEADACKTWALDVNSGVETAPGLKSAPLLRALAKALRG